MEDRKSIEEELDSQSNDVSPHGIKSPASRHSINHPVSPKKSGMKLTKLNRAHSRKTYGAFCRRG